MKLSAGRLQSEALQPWFSFTATSLTEELSTNTKTQNPLASLDCEPLIIMYDQHG